mgnify:CR=1 FL=1
MSKRMIKALRNKYVYVDIDGTLAEYRFNNHVSAKDGTTNGQTREEIENHIFLHSRPLKSIIKTLKRAKHDGIWICGAIISTVELQDKIVWLKNSIDFKLNTFIFRTDRYSFCRDNSSVSILNSADIPIWRAVLVNNTFVVNREHENEIYF